MKLTQAMGARWERAGLWGCVHCAPSCPALGPPSNRDPSVVVAPSSTGAAYFPSDATGFLMCDTAGQHGEGCR